MEATKPNGDESDTKMAPQKKRISNSGLESNTTEAQFPIPFTPDELKNMARAEAYGIPLQKIINWIGSVEARFQVIQKHIEGVTSESIAEALKTKLTQNMPAAPQNVPQLRGDTPGAPGKMGDDPRLLMSLLGMGGSDDSAYKELALESMKENISLARAMKNAIIAQWSAKTAKDLSP